MARVSEFFAVLFAVLRVVKGLTVSLTGSDTCQNFVVDDDEYNASCPLVLCCLV